PRSPVLDALMTLVSEYDSHIVVSPQTGLESPIVATAWNRLKGYDSVEGVKDFIDTYRKRDKSVEDCPIES
ncbi:MAG: DUF3105 domain-containing protein, partial [Acidimicrobiia bacterium]|nr:DUF3105 domain-containing protein [Acidimicrobiia bacterium]